MEIVRKIQLAAAAATVNGIATLALLSPAPALATDCGTGYLECTPDSELCYAAWYQEEYVCEPNRPAGCVTSFSYCHDTTLGCGPNPNLGGLAVWCFYQPA